jgi:hypothetical protein
MSRSPPPVQEVELNFETTAVESPLDICAAASYIENGWLRAAYRFSDTYQPV